MKGASGTYLVTLSNILQRVDFVNLDLELARLEQAEELIGIVFELLASLDVAEQSGTSNLNALGREFAAAELVSSFQRGSQLTYGSAMGGTGPLALPNQTIVPLRFTVSKLPSQVSLPTES